MDNRILTIILGLVIMAGAIKNIFYPMIWTFTDELWTEPLLRFIINLVVHSTVLIGWSVFLIRGGMFDRREGFGPFRFIGLLIIIAGFIIPLIGMALGFHNLSKLTETPLYTLGFGFTIMLFKIENERQLLCFHIPLAILWIIGPLFSGIGELLSAMSF